MTEQNDDILGLSFRFKNEEEIMKSNEVAQSQLLKNDSDVMVLPFVHKLYLMLNDSEEKGYDYIISWIGDGKAFKIHDPSLFEATIQPQYFRQSRVASFVRQVSLEFLFKRNTRSD